MVMTLYITSNIYAGNDVPPLSSLCCYGDDFYFVLIYLYI